MSKIKTLKPTPEFMISLYTQALLHTSEIFLLIFYFSSKNYQTKNKLEGINNVLNQQLKEELPIEWQKCLFPSFGFEACNNEWI